MLLDLYVVNGKEVGCDKYDYKLEWMQDVAGLRPASSSPWTSAWS